MLTSQVMAEWRKQYERVIDTLGVPAVYVNALSGSQKAIAKVGFATIGRDDDRLLQAYGVGAKVITIKASDLPVAPVKFDRVTINAEVNVIEAVHAAYLPGTGSVVGYRCFVKGK